MIAAGEVSAVLVTRGDVDMQPIIDSLPFPLTRVWNNAAGEDLAVYGRYHAIQYVDGDVVYVQDDDCVLSPDSIAALLDAYEPGHVVCNMPARFREHYPDSALVGFGAVFDRDLPDAAFQRWSDFTFDRAGEDFLTNRAPSGLFWRTCDVVFTTLTPRILVDVPVQILDYAHDDSRMWKQPGHVGERQRMLTLARSVRDSIPELRVPRVPSVP